MKNQEVANILYEIADFLEMEDVEWKPRAYRRAARNIEGLSDSLEDIHERGELDEIDGVGENIEEKIAEYLETGKMQYYRELKEELPVDIDALTSVEGLGPKSVKKIYQAVGVTNLDELEEAAENEEIEEIEGFGEKIQDKILEHVEMARKSQERMLLGKAFPIAKKLKKDLQKSDKFNKVTLVGSFRRKRPTVGDIDILATADSVENAMDEFTSREDVKEVLDVGETKSSILVSGNLQIDLRIVDEDSYGAAMQYFTGSKDHNIRLRTIAVKKDWKLNEYGLFDSDDNKLAGETEDSIYNELQLDFIPPELREDTGEIEAASKGEIPNLIEEESVKGDLQMHTGYSDGRNSIREMAEKAEKLGHEYILITDHGQSLEIANGIDEDGLEKQGEEIAELNQEFEVDILRGVEANITKKGIDISKSKLEDLDLVVAALHDSVDNPTERVIEALKEYPIDIFAHPLNRKINVRKPMEINLEELVEAAAEEKVALEINSQPARLDLPWRDVKEYRDQVKFVISTDAHSPSELEYLHLGVSQARRGWCSKENILNTRSIDQLRSYFK